MRKRLSQTLGAIKKGYAVDTYQGGFPVTDVVQFALPVTASGVLPQTDLSSGVQEITSGVNSPDYYSCICVSGNVSTVSGEVEITGTRLNGEVFTEVVDLDGITPVASLNPFNEVLKVKLPAQTTSGEKVSVGGTYALGLKRPLYSSLAKDILVEYAELDVASGVSEYTVEWELINLINLNGPEYDLTLASGEIYLDKERGVWGPPDVFDGVGEDQDDELFLNKISYLTDQF